MSEARPSPAVPCPFDLHVEQLARFLNCELADDPHYTGLEVQWFDDDEHGQGMLVFLERRADRLVDYYVDPALRLDRSTYVLGAGTGEWVETRFDVAELEVSADGVRCHVAFTDLAGRDIEVVVDDRQPGERATGHLLAPVGSAVERPEALLLVHLHGFDLVRRGQVPSRVVIDGRHASTGVLPGQALHGRELIKYAAPLTVITLNRAQEGPVRLVGERVSDAGTGASAGTGTDASDGGEARLDEHGIAGLVSSAGGQQVRLEFRPSFPDLTTLPDLHARNGRWRVYAGDLPSLAGGRWQLRRDGAEVTVDLEVTEGWRPGPLPVLMRLVTTLLPVFRRWPTTYRWQGVVTLGERATLRSAWRRTGQRDGSYQRATGSAG